MNTAQAIKKPQRHEERPRATAPRINRECPECEGDGKIWCDDRADFWNAEYLPCPRCFA